MFDALYPLQVPGAEPPTSPTSLSDWTLATRVAAGADADAEREVCRRFARPIRLYGLRHLHDASAAADLVQEVLLTVLERLRAGALRDPDRRVSDPTT